MRKWRVGTVSMGLTLIILGIVLLVSSFLEADVLSISLTWWPLVLVVLGIEVIVYFITSKQEKPVVHYDFVSIFFIGILGMAGIALYSVTSLGLLEEVKASVHYERVEKALPTFEEELAGAEKIIVHTGPRRMQLETNQAGIVKLFGNYTTNGYQKDDEWKPRDVVNVNRVGDTLHVQMLQKGNQQMEPVLSLPFDVEVEVRGEAASLDVTLDELAADWSIDEGGYVEMKVGDEVNATLNSEETNQVFGEGTHTINVSHVSQVDVY